MQHELRQLPMHDPKRAALIAASDRCERIAAASINPTALLDELRNAIAVLEADTDPSVSSPTRARPVLRLIEGGLSRASKSTALIDVRLAPTSGAKADIS